MSKDGNNRITLRVSEIMEAKLRERAKRQRFGHVNEYVKHLLWREVAEQPDPVETQEMQIKAVAQAVAEMAEALQAMQRRQADFEHLVASAIASSALLLDDGKSDKSQVQERIKRHVRNSLSAGSAVLTLRPTAAAAQAAAHA